MLSPSPIRSLLLALLLPIAAAGLAPAQAQHVRTNPVEAPDIPLVDALLTPGNDLCLGMSWEPTIAVDPNNPMIVAVAQGTTIVYSVDGGDTFPAANTLSANVPGATASDAGWCSGGDPSLGFDSQGRLYLTYLGTRCATGQSCNPPGGGPSTCSIANGRDVFLSGWQLAGNTFVLFTGPRNVSALSGHGAPHNADKEWLAVDWRAGDTKSDNLYVAWSDLDQEPWQIWTTVSTDLGTTWSAAQQLSVASEGRRVWPAHNTVARNHDAYVAYHAQANFLDGAPDYDVPSGRSGSVIVHRSTNGGGSYTKTATNPFDTDGSTFSEADMTWNVQHKPNGVIPGASYWLLGSVQPWILADPAVSGRIYVVCNDDPDDNIDAGDAANVYIARSNDFGATWSAPIRVDDSPGVNWTVMPTAAIDPVGGAIVVTWYDSRSGATGTSGDRLLDVRASFSADGGLNWFPSIDVDDGQLDPGLSASCRFCCPGVAPACPAGSPRTLRIGEYNGVAFGECAAHMVWAGNQTCGSGGSLLDTFYDRDPELGGDLTPPVIQCPPHTSVGCNASTHPNATGYATATDDCDVDPDVGWVDVLEPGNCPPSTVLYSIRRIWNATDQAGNIITCDQHIGVVDFDAPTINLPADLVLNGVTAGCLPSNHPAIQAWLALITTNEACTTAHLSYNLPAVFPAGCAPGRTTDIIFSVNDDCGNSDFAVGHVTLITPPSDGIPFCFGDGTGTLCPCGNTGLTGHGCDISQGTGGVCLSAQNFNPNGLGGGTVDFLGTNYPVGATPLAILLRSENYENGLAGIVFGDGKLCLGSPIQRLGNRQIADGKVDFPHVHTSGTGRWHYQLWFRNLPQAFCDPAAGYNTSNAVSLTW